MDYHTQNSYGKKRKTAHFTYRKKWGKNCKTRDTKEIIKMITRKEFLRCSKITGEKSERKKQNS